MIKKLRKSLSYMRVFTTERRDLRVIRVDDARLLLEAQRLHARVYLDRGFIDASQVNANGVLSRIHDPYQEHSQYFVVEAKLADGSTKIVATARAILGVDHKGHKSFPTLAKLEINAEARSKLQSVHHGACLEVSALAKVKGTGPYPALMLYRAIWQFAVLEHRQMVIMACDASVYSHLKFLFGGALTQIGNKAFYMGSYVVPAVLDVQGSISSALSEARGWNPVQRKFKHRLVLFFTRGLPTIYLQAEPAPPMPKEEPTTKAQVR